MVVDKNVAEYIVLLGKVARLNLERLKFLVLFHPKNPITNLMMSWKYRKIAAQLKKELDASSQTVHKE
jgi:hypothetical protein